MLAPPPPSNSMFQTRERERKPEENYEIRNGMACDGKENQRSAGIGGKEEFKKKHILASVLTVLEWKKKHNAFWSFLKKRDVCHEIQLYEHVRKLFVIILA